MNAKAVKFKCQTYRRKLMPYFKNKNKNKGFAYNDLILVRY